MNGENDQEMCEYDDPGNKKEVAIYFLWLRSLCLPSLLTKCSSTLHRLEDTLTGKKSRQRGKKRKGRDGTPMSNQLVSQMLVGGWQKKNDLKVHSAAGHVTSNYHV